MRKSLRIMSRRPRLARVLLAVNLLIFMLPLGGIAILRLYESELIRHTETELNVQGALVAAIYRTELLKLPNSEAYGIAIPIKKDPDKNAEDLWHPMEASLDIAKDRIYPPSPDAVEPNVGPDASALAAGKRVTPILLSARTMTLSAVRVMDFRGVVVASTGGDIGKSLAAQEEVAKALQGRHVSALRERIQEDISPSLGSMSRGARVRVHVAMPVIHGDRTLGVVLLSRTPMDLPKALYQRRGYLVGGGVVMILVVCVVTSLTTRLVTRPVKALIHQAEEVTLGAKGGATAPLERPGTYEVDQLSRALAEMSATLEKRADYIRAFASNVSHEFKTPLTSIRGTVELLKDHIAGMSPEERARFLNILDMESDRLARLVNRLLELARADVAERKGAQCNIAQVFRQVAERFSSDSITVTFDFSAETLAVAMSPEVLDSILSNLVDNAGRHGGPTIRVHLSAKPEIHEDKRFVAITVQDDGPGVPESHRDRIFTPFFTTARPSGGTGLGLAIVQALVTAHHGAITLEPSESGARFRLTAPAVRLT
jgi:signal transduction histidine kinase